MSDTKGEKRQDAVASNIILDESCVECKTISSIDHDVGAEKRLNYEVPLTVASQKISRDIEVNIETRQLYDLSLKRVRKTYDLYSWILAVIAYPLLLLLTAVFFWLTLDAIGDITTLAQNGRAAFTYVAIASTGTVVALLFLVVFLVKFWNEHEVRSRHHGFIIHYCLLAFWMEVSIMSCALIWMQVTGLKMMNPDGRSLNGTWDKLMLTSFVLVSFGALEVFAIPVARMQYIYELTCRRNIAPRYWMVPVCYGVLYFCTAFISIMVCRYAEQPCTAAEQNSGAILFVCVVNVHYFWCAWSSRSARNLFPDYWGNVRMFSMYAVIIWGTIIYGVLADSVVHTTLLYLYVPHMTAWTYGLESFAFVVVRVMSRHLRGREALANLDVAGNHYRQATYAEGVTGLLQIDELAAMLLEHSRKAMCEENIGFLMAVSEGRKCTTIAEQQDKIKHILDTYIVPRSKCQVNLSHAVREEIVERLSRAPYAENNPMETFDAAFMEITVLVTVNILPSFMQSEEFLDWTQRREREDKLVALLRKNQLLRVH